jgi:hypothetical protein
MLKAELPLEVAFYRDVIRKMRNIGSNNRHMGEIVHITEVLSYSRDMAPTARRLNITTLQGIARDDDVGFLIRGVEPDRYTIVRAVNDLQESSAEMEVCLEEASGDGRSMSVIKKRFLYDSTSGHWNEIVQ